jgi:Protein of unknown function with HXXEE motif
MTKNLGMAIATAVAGYACKKIIGATRQRSREMRMPESAADRVIDTRLVAQPGSRGATARVVVPTAMAVGGMTVFSKMSHGNTLRYTFVPTLAASWVLYMLLLRRRRPDPTRLMPLYFVSLAWQFVHFIEENQTGFRYRWPVEIFQTEPYGDKQYVAINVLSYAAFILGGVALMVDRREFSLPAVFFSVMGVMFNGVQHPIYAWKVRGYFPGLWTSTVDLVLGPILLKRLFGAPAAEPHLI